MRSGAAVPSAYRRSTSPKRRCSNVESSVTLPTSRPLNGASAGTMRTTVRASTGSSATASREKETPAAPPNVTVPRAMTRLTLPGTASSAYRASSVSTRNPPFALPRPTRRPVSPPRTSAGRAPGARTFTSSVWNGAKSSATSLMVSSFDPESSTVTPPRTTDRVVRRSAPDTWYSVGDSPPSVFTVS